MGRFNCMESKQVLVHIWWNLLAVPIWFFSHQHELVLFRKLLNFGKHQIDIILRGYWSIVLDLPPIFNALIQKLVFYLFLCKDVCFCIWHSNFCFDNVMCLWLFRFNLVNLLLSVFQLSDHKHFFSQSENLHWSWLLLFLHGNGQ